MMGPRQMAQGALFYDVPIEQHVPADHLVRRIDRFVDLSEIRGFLAPFDSATGRPSVDSGLMDDPDADGRLLLRIRSERRLREEVHLNLAYRWFCRLALGDGVPEPAQAGSIPKSAAGSIALPADFFNGISVKRSLAAGITLNAFRAPSGGGRPLDAFGSAR